MFGVVTRDRKAAARSPFDPVYFECKGVTGRRADPIAGATSMISCFGDTARGERSPDLVPVSDTGERATREMPYFDWGFICPNREAYRSDLLDTIEEAATISHDVRLDDIGFPREEYCHCEACVTAFEESAHTNRDVWRCDVITSFLEEASERVPGRLAVTIYPDPFPGHLEARAGVNVDDLAPLVDSFVVPIYDLAYTTTYWLEIIAKGFESRLPRPFQIELYAVDVGVDALEKAATVAGTYADGVVFAYDESTAKDVVKRLEETG